MLRILALAFALLVLAHGLIHLAGFAAYWPLATLRDLPYKTTVLGGRADLGATGTRLISLLWLLAGIGFMAAAIGIFARSPAWAPVLLASTVLSLSLCVLDWQAAVRGALVDVVLLLVLFVVFGLRVAPAPFALPAVSAGAVERVPLPPNLPAPVERFYRAVYGSDLPVYHSAILTGRGTVRFMGLTMPARLRFTHDASRGYHHYIETTFYGFPLMRVNEHYLDGRSRFVLPMGVQENDPNLDSAANLGLWAERIAYPAAFVTDPRVRWEAADDTTARLHLPFGDTEQSMTVSFDPVTHRLTRIEADRRFADAKRGYLRWWGTVDEWAALDGVLTPVRQSVQWADQDRPWLHVTTEDVVFNADVSQYIEQSGP